MSTVIKIDRGIVEDAAELVPLARWLEWREVGHVPHPGIGVRLEPDDDFEVLLPNLDSLTLIAVNFPVFTDGRGYSVARLLRGRYGYRGELRAVGDVLRDQLYFMRRCGFDAFALRADQDVELALRAFEDYSVSYQ
jgi:uncharacterized protein (DUF934 family)